MKYIYLLLFAIGFTVYPQDSDYHITNINLNTEYPHFGLSKIGDSKVIFTSYQLNKRGKVVLSGGNPVLEIYKADLNVNGVMTNVETLKIDENVELPTITSATMSPNGNFLYITTLYSKKNKPKGNFKETNFHIEVAEFKEGIGWTNFKVLPFCDPKYSYAHPNFSSDGKMLYFTANIRGGKETTKGGSDIFKVEVLGDNQFSEPMNLGSQVNSYSREMFPYIIENALYFASNRPGYGGFDLYKSLINKDGAFEKAERLPKPLNSNKDDLSLIKISTNSGFIVSKRDGGKGDDDIYYFIED